jgi:hypothetical protein
MCRVVSLDAPATTPGPTGATSTLGALDHVVGPPAGSMPDIEPTAAPTPAPTHAT